MIEPVAETLCIIAGKGAYPLLLTGSARRQGVKRIVAVAFRGETDRAINGLADEVEWIYIGQFGKMLDAISRFGASNAVMAGQITPTSLFTVRVDGKFMALLGRLKVRNAETIFGAVGEELRAIGVELLPAHSFMHEHMARIGTLGRRDPDEREKKDIELGLKVADVTSSVDIGQTVVIKDGTILAVEAFEGTDEAILRAGRLGGRGGVVVKVAKRGHDMRFDIPVIGMHTMKVLKKAGVSCIAMQDGRAILLEKDRLIVEADRQGVAMVCMPFGG